MTPIIVSDTSPLRALAFLDRLEWLEVMFGRVVIPTSVANELEEPPARFVPIIVQAIPFIEVREPALTDRVAYWRQHLDPGEAEALALAEELSASVLLMDEATGRQLARQAKFVVLGTMGILLEAKARGLCFEIRPLIDALQIDLNFFISAALRDAVLRTAGEHD